MENNKRKKSKPKNLPESHNYLPSGDAPPGTVLGYP
jgi:hypothetical protein